MSWPDTFPQTKPKTTGAFALAGRNKASKPYSGSGVTSPPESLPPELEPPDEEPPSELDPPDEPPELEPPEDDPPELDPPDEEPPELDPPELAPPDDELELPEEELEEELDEEFEEDLRLELLELEELLETLSYSSPEEAELLPVEASPSFSTPSSPT